jgi:hypothetical protein
MKWAVRQLCAPLRYLLIKQGHGWFSSKTSYDVVLPMIFAAFAALAVWKLDAALGFFSQSGFVPGIINLLNLLIAFFIAALAAVATFNRAGLDDPLKGEPATMRRMASDGVTREKILTHRQFICYLFGYLSFISITLLLTLYAIRLIGEEAAPAPDFMLDVGSIAIPVREILRGVGSFFFFFVFGQIIVTMLLGIYFLADRFQFLDDPHD